MTKRKEYLNNKDMMKEIHKSKLSYCYLLDEKYAQFDMIVESENDITPDTIFAAKEARAARLSREGYEAGINVWHANVTKETKPKQIEFRVDPNDILEDDIVFRVMTYDHIPSTPNRKKTPKTIADLHTRINFPPFKHYAKIEGNWIEVVRSHWKDGFSNGEFCQTHGNMTSELAKMIMMIVSRYAMRANWRSYTYNDEMQSTALLQLSDVGLKFNEAKSQNPFAYFTTIINNSFTGVLNTEKKNQHIRDDLLQDGGYMPSFNRQFEDEEAQKRAREEDQKNAEQELKERGYNIV